MCKRMNYTCDGMQQLQRITTEKYLTKNIDKKKLCRKKVSEGGLTKRELCQNEKSSTVNSYMCV